MTEKYTPVPNKDPYSALDELIASLDRDTEELEGTQPAELPMPASSRKPAHPNFPELQQDRLSTSSDEARHLLTLTCHEFARHGDYDSVRNRICQLQLELNEYGLLAPSFRPRPKKSRPKSKDSKKSFTAADMAIHRDLIVIDCHWLYARKVRVRVSSGDMLYQPLFSYASPFDYDLAWRFANENWSNDTRVGNALRLPKLLQYQLAALRCNDIANDLERLHVGTRKGGVLLKSAMARVSIALQEWCEEDSRVESQFEIYEAIYQAYWLLGPTAKLATLTDLTGMIHGSAPLSPRTLSGKLKKLLDRMGEESAMTGPSSDKFS